jgi:hypothetical protein
MTSSPCRSLLNIDIYRRRDPFTKQSGSGYVIAAPDR